jgi:hypothetical protein
MVETPTVLLLGKKARLGLRKTQLRRSGMDVVGNKQMTAEGRGR